MQQDKLDCRIRSFDVCLSNSYLLKETVSRDFGLFRESSSSGPLSIILLIF